MKLKTIMPFKVDVLEAERVNYFIQNGTALVNSKGEVNLLSEGQTTPSYPTIPTASLGLLKELSRHVGNGNIMNTEPSTGSLPGPGRARKEARSKMMWLTSCG